MTAGVNIGMGENYEQINFTIPNYDKGYISFEFQGANFNRPCLGIKFNPRKEVKNCVESSNMKVVLNRELTKNNVGAAPLWPAYYYFDPQDWKGSSEAWLMINEGTMADKILEEMDTVFQVLNDNHLLNEKF